MGVLAIFTINPLFLHILHQFFMRVCLVHLEARPYHHVLSSELKKIDLLVTSYSLKFTFLLKYLIIHDC